MTSTDIVHRFSQHLKTGDWVLARHIRFASLFYLAASALVVVLLFTVPNSFNPGDGKPLLTDFLSFWAAAGEANAGRPELPYFTGEFQKLQFELTGTDKFFSFFYPPTFLLAVLPFGLAGFAFSFIAFNALGVLVYWAMTRTVTGDSFVALMLCAFPPAMICVFHGQNALFLATLLGLAMVCLQRDRPVLAGVLIGLMTVKPQLGILLPLALLADRQWITIFTAAATTLLFAGVSYLVFGQETWLAFIAQVPIAGQTLQEGLVDWEKMVSVYAGLRTLGLGHVPTQIIQGIITIVAAVLVYKSWRSPASIVSKVMVLVPFSILATPFALSYDLTLLAVPLAFWVAEVRQQGARLYEKSIMAICVILTATSSGAAMWAGLPLGPFAAAGIAYLGVQRTLVKRPQMAAC